MKNNKLALIFGGCTAMACSMANISLAVAAEEEQQSQQNQQNIEQHNHNDGDANSPIMADSHGPIGVMGDHMHHDGEIMLSFRTMYMSMDGNQRGTHSLSASEVQTQQGYMMVPTQMDMTMYMLGMMYAPTDDITLMAMSGFSRKDMTIIRNPAAMGGMPPTLEFNTHSSGLTDTRLSANIRLVDFSTGSFNHHFHGGAGISLPTGSIDEKSVTPASGGMAVIMPYTMQLGSGTFDFMPSLTYTGNSNDFSWGAQYRAMVRMGSNDNGYRLGNEQMATAWAAWSPIEWANISARIQGKDIGDINGRNPNLAFGMIETADPNNYGGQSADLSFGVNLVGQTGLFRGHRLALELGRPIYQDLNGVQMSSDWWGMIGWQFAW